MTFYKYPESNDTSMLVLAIIRVVDVLDMIN